MQRISERSGSREIFSGLYAPPPLAARADGRGFKKLLQGKRKPYDIDFARSMVRATEGIFSDSGLAPAFAFTFSDEVSLVFLEAPFAGRLEKIDSLIAGSLSASLSLQLARPVSLDCRTIPLCQAEIVDYLIERQEETWRNHVFSYGFYMLLQEGLSNVRKHANASHVRLALRRTQNASLVVQLADNGQGIAKPINLAELSDEKHFGLLGISERISLLRGAMQVREQASGGLELLIEIPSPYPTINPQAE